MEIRFYELNGIKHNQINKYIITSYVYIDGELRDAVEISNPTIIIDISSNSNINAVATSETLKTQMILAFRNYYTRTFNYVYIPTTGRYYWIKKINLLRKNILSIELHVDVLQSFSSFIYNQNAFVIRNKTHYHIELPDERRILTNESIIEYLSLTDTLSSDNYIKFDTSYIDKDGTLFDFPQVYNIYACCTSNNIDRNWLLGHKPQRFEQPERTSLPRVVTGLFVSKEFHGYVLNFDLTSELIASVKNNSSVASAVSTIYAYPFNFKELPDYKDTWEDLSKMVEYKVADVRIGGPTYYVHDVKMTSGYLLNTSFIVPNDIQDFNDLEPYSVYELYIPYYGYYKLPYNSVRGHELYIYYIINFQCGEASVIVYDNTSNNILTSLKAQIGIEIPKNLSNALEVRNRRDANNTSLTIGLITSALSIIGGVASMNPLLIGGGVAGAGGTIAKYAISEKNNLAQYSTVNFNGDLVPLFSPQNAFIRKTKRVINYDLTNDFLEENGGVLNELRNLLDLRGTGYTEIGEIPNIRVFRSSNPTDTEIDEIITLLKNGVIL